MACLTLIGGNRNLTCGAPPAGQLGRPVSAKLLNASQILSFTIAGDSPIATITRAVGTAAINLEA